MPLQCHCESELINSVMAELAPCEFSLGVSVLASPDLSLYTGIRVYRVSECWSGFHICASVLVLLHPSWCWWCSCGVSALWSRFSQALQFKQSSFVHQMLHLGKEDLPETILGWTQWREWALLVDMLSMLSNNCLQGCFPPLSEVLFYLW